MKVVDPASGRLLREIPEHEPAELLRRLDRAALAFTTWRATAFRERAVLLHAAAAVLRRDGAPLAELMTREMGKPIVQSEGEIEKCSWACEYFAEHAARFLAPEAIATDASRSAVHCEPLGAVLAVMPWNFPFWQVFRAAAPALMAGNVMLLKHASNVPGCALAIEQVLADAGLPAGVFATLLASPQAIEPLVAHPAIAAVTLTGSEAAGASLGAAAGRALKKTVMELGGSDPFLVLADADPEAVATQAAAARTINSGQSCIAAKRFIVEEPIAQRFETALVTRMRALKVGDPMDRATEVGPLAREDLIAELDRQVYDSVVGGATLRTGGAQLERPGFYYAPTVVTNVRPGLPVFTEETFGPVAAVVRARDADHAVELANISRFGLGASVWTADSERGEAIAARIKAGQVFVNGIVKSDPRLPFGGVKHSGHGRELAAAGIREFVNLKTVWVR
ncbi:MAG TPA: NAD-dependent succinate-semialdehyde dehydrogenase [Candidatus Limnocylindria bacterium]|nr:NAD-dependent succinate-semialdehyde dehydrogenase [Candidatus Limnocylindria bacterium]